MAERGMELLEFNTHSFIVKIWLEEPGLGGRRGKWRGYITHVPSGERRYLESLNEILAFMIPYLLSMGVRLEGYWRFRDWLSRRRRRRPIASRPIELPGQRSSSTDPDGRQGEAVLERTD